MSKPRRMCGVEVMGRKAWASGFPWVRVAKGEGSAFCCMSRCDLQMPIDFAAVYGSEAVCVLASAVNRRRPLG